MAKEYALRVRLIEEKSELYTEPRIESIVIKEVEVGTVVRLGKTIKRNGKHWVETMVGEVEGYILGDAPIFPIQKAKLNQKEVTVYEKPFLESAIKANYKKNTIFYLTDKVTVDSKDWVRIRDLSNNVGYVDGDTMIDYIQPLPDMKSDLGSWGIGLIAIGVISNLIPDFLNAAWGIIVVLLGIAILSFKKRIMYIVIAVALFVVGLMNLLTGASGWTVFGGLQIYWAFQEMMKFWKYKKLAEKGEADQDILLNIDQYKTGLEDIILNVEESVETEI